MDTKVFEEAKRIKKEIQHCKEVTKHLNSGCVMELHNEYYLMTLDDPKVKELLISHYEKELKNLEKEFEEL